MLYGLQKLATFILAGSLVTGYLLIFLQAHERPPSTTYQTLVNTIIPCSNLHRLRFYLLNNNQPQDKNPLFATAYLLSEPADHPIFRLVFLSS